MIISKEFFDQCSPSYQKAINDFEQKIADIEEQDGGDPEIKASLLKAHFVEFVANYYAPMDYWKRFYEFDLKDYKYYEENGITELYVYQRQHEKLFEHIKMHDSDKYLYVLEYVRRHDDFLFCCHSTAKHELQYPHSHLLHFFHNYEKDLTCPPSKELIQIYENMKLLYKKIKAAKDDVETWFKLLLEVGIEDFVVHVVEYRIACNLNDQKLWKLYIEYLKEISPKKMLKWYSKYCRFFLDDFEMKAKYETEMKEYGPVKLSWANLFEFEKGFLLDQNENGKSNENSGETNAEGSNESGEFEDSDEAIQNDENQEGQNVKDVTNKIASCEIYSRPLKDICAEFDVTVINQKFSMSKPIIKYLLENADHMVLQKLFKTCKYFFAKKLTPLCYRFRCRDYDVEFPSGILFANENLLFVGKDCDTEILKNIVISTVFAVTAKNIPIEHLSKQICPYIYRCEAKLIVIYYQELSFNELLLLIGHGNVINLDMCKCKIRDVDGSLVALEKIMEYLPNIEKLE
uniref:Uncharacterized protein n=1 Tax=Panagrolaimus sp. ES5 TaxID=591445 RepID=A0AC34G2L9_9BILA